MLNRNFGATVCVYMMQQISCTNERGGKFYINSWCQIKVYLGTQAPRQSLRAWRQQKQGRLAKKVRWTIPLMAAKSVILIHVGKLKNHDFLTIEWHVNT